MQYKTFCAANSGKGFISFFDTILDEQKQTVHYIKGGPGCGKSTFLKRIAARATDAELIYCSGDPNSLDGIILPKENTVIIDATAPHSYEPKFPGVGGSMINLGEGFEPRKLNKEAILNLSKEKSLAYKKSYHLLKSAKNIHEGIFSALAQKIDFKGLSASADKFLKQNALWDQQGAPIIPVKRFLSAISPDGRITFSETFMKFGNHVLLLEDRWFQAYIYLRYLDQKLTQNGIAHINGYHPLFGEPILQHIIIPKASLSIVTKDGYFPVEIPNDAIIKTINIQSYLPKDFLQLNKNKLAFAKRLERELLNLAEENLAEAKALHMKIEQEYAKGFSHQSTESLKIKLLKNLFGES